MLLGSTAIIFVMIVKLTKDWLKDQRHTQQLEKEKLETELKFLRSQFNPHFLFNTINSIHFLIRKGSRTSVRYAGEVFGSAALPALRVQRGAHSAQERGALSV